MSDDNDNPEWDATDAAHPAWWRGEQYGFAECLRAVTAVPDGTDAGRGVTNEPWESVRRRLLGLVAAAARWEGEMSAGELVAAPPSVRTCIACGRPYRPPVGKQCAGCKAFNRYLAALHLSWGHLKRDRSAERARRVRRYTRRASRGLPLFAGLGARVR